MREPTPTHAARPGPSPGCAALLRALADDTRLAIMRALLGGARSVTELCEALRLPQSLASRHLAVLRGQGLVLANRRAQRVIYAVAPDVRGKLNGSGERLDLGCCEVRFQ